MIVLYFWKGVPILTDKRDIKKEIENIRFNKRFYEK